MSFLYHHIRHLPSLYYRNILYDYAYKLGRPLSYPGERDGKKIHDIRPGTSLVESHTSLGIGALGLHTEMAFLQDRPRFVLLFCIRNKKTPTRIVSTWDVLSNLDSLTLGRLRTPSFRIYPPTSYTAKTADFWQPMIDAQNRLVIASHCDTTFLDMDSYIAYRKTLALAESMSKKLILQPGDLLILNNDRVFHGRDDIVLPKDSDRLLYRMYVG